MGYAPEYTVQWGYRTRDQALGVSIQHSQTGQLITAFAPLGDVLRTCGVTPDEYQAAIGDGEVNQPPPPDGHEFDALRRSALPLDLTGKTAIDVGGYDGSISKLLLDRGAVRVRLIDNGEWINYGWRVPKLPEGITYIGCDVLEWQEPADVVVCGNVVYHVRDPWRFLWHLKTICHEQLILWTSFVEGDGPVWRVMDWSDQSNATVPDGYYPVYWKPTVSGLFRLLARTGWTNLTEVGRSGDHIVVTAVPA
jgi:hypothetical protein